ncbi:T6SS immunity protein Tdi1 domain-containing protein [Bradyrhizobium sp. SZCCHNS3002]|uniref:T6SS immunity protein Tdi1 domain-containing protein n=1 Tax=Bradyrhizobium sp. SZCCHNS3002 TaxID=3057310 RepID=UPI0028E4503C|nr:T6SS immunity protein Tdi1 domain-containing protein [Bradyrhizobium sp. SZCCHNS3002]
MFETFKRHFLLDAGPSPIGPLSDASLRPEAAKLFAEFGGCSFNGGLYRVVRVSSLDTWAARVGYAFPEFKGRIACFGYDWLGRAFATDEKRLEGGKPGVVMFEPGTGEALKIPANIETFHDGELVNFGEAVLAIDFFQRWQKLARTKLEYDQCAGYKKPLFLGGVDDVGNLEPSDIDVYWHISGQLILKAKGLPVGTPIRISRP